MSASTVATTSSRNTVPLNMTASSHASAATPPAITPPRSAVLTVFAARSLRLRAGPGVSRSAAMELMTQRYRSPRRAHLWLAPENLKGPGPVNQRDGARPPYLRGDGHPLLFAGEALLLGGDFEVHRVREVRLARRELQERVGEADRAGECV